MKNLLVPLALLCLALPAAAAEAPPSSPQTEDACESVRAYLKKFPALELRSGPGSVRVTTIDKTALKKGCFVGVSGKYPPSGEVPAMNRFFELDGWKPVPRYTADGPGSGQMGFFKGTAAGTFCLSQFDFGVELDAPPTRADVRVSCVDAALKTDPSGDLVIE